MKLPNLPVYSYVGNSYPIKKCVDGMVKNRRWRNIENQKWCNTKDDVTSESEDGEISDEESSSELQAANTALNRVMCKHHLAEFYGLFQQDEQEDD